MPAIAGKPAGNRQSRIGGQQQRGADTSGDVAGTLRRNEAERALRRGVWNPVFVRGRGSRIRRVNAQDVARHSRKRLRPTCQARRSPSRLEAPAHRRRTMTSRASRPSASDRLPHAWHRLNYNISRIDSLCIKSAQRLRCLAKVPPTHACQDTEPRHGSETFACCDSHAGPVRAASPSGCGDRNAKPVPAAVSGLWSTHALPLLGHSKTPAIPATRLDASAPRPLL